MSETAAVHWPQVCYHCGNQAAADLRQTFVGPWVCRDRPACTERRRQVATTYEPPPPEGEDPA